jgi:hypothetical protein
VITKVLTLFWVEVVEEVEVEVVYLTAVEEGRNYVQT